MHHLEKNRYFSFWQDIAGLESVKIWADLVDITTFGWVWIISI